MSNKQNKFRPNQGLIVAVHQNILGIRAVAQHLNIPANDLAAALEKAGFQVVPDPFDLSADAGKVIPLQDAQAQQGLRAVSDEPSSDTGADRETTV